jgi:Dipeptidyl aminopeptidases/acylaminoacyl-peptidases
MSRRQWMQSIALLALQGGELSARPIRSKSDWKARREQVLSGMREVMGPLPEGPAGTPDVVMQEETVFPQFTRRKITFASGDGDVVPAYLFVPNGRTHPGPAALCLHQTVAIGKAEPAGLGGKPNLHYALELAERGFTVLAPDYPRFGDYKIDAYSMGYLSTTMKGIRNHRRAVDLLTTLKEVDPGRIGVIGHSLGGHNSLFVAAFDQRFAAVVTSCGFTPSQSITAGI